MKQLSKTQNIIFLVGGVLMVIGAGCFAFMWQQEIMCWIYLIGAVMFATMQMMQTYSGNNFTQENNDDGRHILRPGRHPHG